MTNRYQLLQRYMELKVDKYATKIFSYQITDKQHDQVHEDRCELIQFAKSQTKAKRPQEIPPPWDEGMVIKYRWGEAVPD